MNKIKPHLCCDVDISKLKLPIWGFPKLDGVRLMHIAGKATGRSLKEHGNRHITDKYSCQQYLGFDGESTFGDIRGDSLCRDTTSVMSRIEGQPEIVWNLFDWLHPEQISLCYKERYFNLVSYIQSSADSFASENICVIPYTELHSIEEVVSFYEKCLNEGYEGAVFRDPDGMHKSGRATVKEGAYLRMKPQSDKEAIVSEIVEAQENQNEKKINELGRSERSSHKENKVGKGMVGSLICKDLSTGQVITVGAGKMTHEERIYFFQHPEELLNCVVKYRSMDVGIKDKPRFGRYICKRSLEDMS